MKESDKQKTTIYLKNVDEFKYLRDKVSNLWYQSYGIYLSTGDVLLAALKFTVERLRNERGEANEVDSRVSSLYYRIGK